MRLKDYIAGFAERVQSISPQWWRIARVTWLRRGNSGVNTMAAAIGFYALICIGPLGLLLAWALQFIVGPGDRSYEWLQRAVNRMTGEAAGAIMGEIDALLTNPNAHVAGIISFFLLVWAGLRLFEILEISLTSIWPRGEERGLVARKLVALASMLGAGALLIIAILLTALLPAAINLLGEYTAINVDEIVLLQPGVRIIAEVAVAFAAFFLLFKYIPVQKVPTRVAVVGAAFTAIAWRAVTPIFTLTVARSAQGSTIYGGLAGVVMFLMWAFFGGHVLLLGAHFSAAYEHVMCYDRPQSFDDAFIRMAPHDESPGPDEDKRIKDSHRPSSHPPPGRV